VVDLSIVDFAGVVVWLAGSHLLLILSFSDEYAGLVSTQVDDSNVLDIGLIRPYPGFGEAESVVVADRYSTVGSDENASSSLGSKAIAPMGPDVSTARKHPQTSPASSLNMVMVMTSYPPELIAHKREVGPCQAQQYWSRCQYSSSLHRL
jgi:hypothetical protein